MVRDLEQYSQWRQGVMGAVANYRDWVVQADLSDAATEQRLAQTLSKLADDKLSVAFVAEFSRGKSELINSIFFADFGQRILPSAAGRTTMCPTELMYDPAYPACIRRCRSRRAPRTCRPATTGNSRTPGPYCRCSSIPRNRCRKCSSRSA